MDNTNALTVAAGSQLAPYIDTGDGAVVPVVRGRMSPPNLRIPLDVTQGDVEPDWAQFTKRTPKEYRRVAKNENTGVILYRYVPIIWVVKCLNAGFHYKWGFEIIDEVWDDPVTNARGVTSVPYTCVGQLVAPGLFRPIIGVGSSNFYTNNPQESKAKTRNAALTSALKAAAKQLGVGRDVEEDDPEVARMLEGTQRSIQTMFDKLVERGRGDDAKAVIRKYQPDALLDSGALMVGAIETEHLDEIARGLTSAATAKVAVAQ